MNSFDADLVRTKADLTVVRDRISNIRDSIGYVSTEVHYTPNHRRDVRRAIIDLCGILFKMIEASNLDLATRNARIHELISMVNELQKWGTRTTITTDISKEETND